MVEEKKIYRFEYFKVSRNSLSFGATTHPFKITFSTKTYVAEVEAEIPFEVFSFMPIADIKALPESQNIDYLVG